MTKSTITRERLEWLAQISCRDDIEDIGGDEIRELASMALAAMDSEPVGEFYEDGPLNWYQISDGDRVPSHRRIPLYRHAQPAPVEVRNKLKAEALADLLKDAREYAPLTAEQWELLANNWHQTFVGLSGEGDTCRAALLQAEPVVSIPAKRPIHF